MQRRGGNCAIIINGDYSETPTNCERDYGGKICLNIPPCKQFLLRPMIYPFCSQSKRHHDTSAKPSRPTYTRSAASTTLKAHRRSASDVATNGRHITLYTLDTVALFARCCCVYIHFLLSPMPNFLPLASR